MSMLTGGGWRLPRSAWLLLAGLSVVGGAATTLLLGGQGRIHFTGVPQLQLPLPRPPADAPAVLPESEPGGTSSSQSAASVPVLPALIEEGPFGPLPRIAPDGRRPFLAYARPFNLDDQRSRIAVVVVGLGLQTDLTEAAIGLPGEISLHFSAYAPDLPSWFERARRVGHEVLLDLPMEPLDYPASDPGPRTLLVRNSTEENLKRLDWLLARATGYVAVAGSGARFAASERASPVLDVLARRGLAVVELGQPNLKATAAAVGLPYASAPTAIDADPSVLSINHALAALEVEALQKGSAVGVAQGYPVSLERLRRWAATLGGKGLVLAPISAVVIEQSGLAAEMRGDAEHHGRAQG
jgi:polysaccharide deacetylase 2 family uncharacterized protein YibQ